MIAPSAWAQLQFIQSPFCKNCGTPFPFDVPNGTVCAQCLKEPPVFDTARAALVYDATARPLILALKYADRQSLVPLFNTWLTDAGQTLLVDCTLIIPVPMHWRRLLRRKFNQAALLAKALAKAHQKTYAPLWLQRATHKRPQEGLNREARLKNVKNNFVVPQKFWPQIKDQTVLLIDDVLTTGATASECAKALKKAGAAKVYVLAVARTLVAD
jgi:ComF family protein